MTEPNRDLDTLLADAVAAGDTSRVAGLLEAGASPNASVHRDSPYSAVWWSDTPVLYSACKSKLEDVVALLLERGADPDAHLYRHENMLQERIPSLVAAFPSLAIVERLLRAGAEPNTGHWQREDAGWEQSPLALAPTEELRSLLRRYGAKG